MRAPPIRNQPRIPNVIIHLHRQGYARVAQLSGGLAVRLAHIMIVSTTIGRTKAAGSGEGEKQRRINFGFSRPPDRHRLRCHRLRRRRRRHRCCRHSHRCNSYKKQQQIEQTRNKGLLGVTCESPLRRLLTLLSVMGPVQRS